MSLKRRQSRKLGSRRKLEECYKSSEGLQKREGTASEAEEGESEGQLGGVGGPQGMCVPGTSNRGSC